MTIPKSQRKFLDSTLSRKVLVLTLLCGFTMIAALSAQPQTFSVIHYFSGGADGGTPYATPTLDAAGRPYATTLLGGIYVSSCVQGGCGVAFRMRSSGEDWVLAPLYSFPGVLPNGISPSAPLTLAADGTLYGTTTAGGGAACFEGCGTVFHLTPPPTPCETTLCPWNETVIYAFQGATDGYEPSFSGVVFDSAGNLYGTTQQGGANGVGTIYKLSRSGGVWTKTILHSFAGAGDGSLPMSGVILDAAGNLFGTTNQGGDLTCNYSLGCGTVFELSPSPSGWTETTLYTFEINQLGENPIGGLVFDASGNLFGSAGDGTYHGGTVYELQPSNGSWTISLLKSFEGNGGPLAALTLDAAGNLYGTTVASGAHYEGSVFKLAKQGSSWQFTDLHDFHIDDGWKPAGGVAVDSRGNIYGTTSQGGTGSCSNGCGVMFEITP
jgi:uncharacterized repeat protein (TIGR03803 family)